jgi:hypothetical protein
MKRLESWIAGHGALKPTKNGTLVTALEQFLDRNEKKESN